MKKKVLWHFVNFLLEETTEMYRKAEARGNVRFEKRFQGGQQVDEMVGIDSIQLWVRTV